MRTTAQSASRASGKAISLAAQAAPHAVTSGVRGLIEAHGQSIDLSEFPALTDLLGEGRTLRLLDMELPPPVRLAFNATLGGRAALVAPVRIGEQTFGLLGLVWSEAREGFDEHEIALVEGIAVQIGTALERDQLSAEVMRLKSVLGERHTEDRIIGQTPLILRASRCAERRRHADIGADSGRVGTGKELSQI